MAECNFKGDITNITEDQLEFIHKILKENGHGNSKVNFESIGQAGDNFSANIKRITIESENERVSWIVKIAPTNEGARTLLDIYASFSNEHLMYSEVLSKFTQLQTNAGISEENQLRYAKYYGSNIKVLNEVIILEDLKPLNYGVLNRFEPLSNDHVKSILKYFAVYHSLSFILRLKEPDAFEYYKSKLIDIYKARSKREDILFLFKFYEQELLDNLDEPEHIECVKRNFLSSLDAIGNFSDAECDSDYSVILQGDAWTTNIMFKYEVDKPPECVMIDYQLSKNGSPMYDLMFMIFICTDYKSRSQHFYDWIDYYYSELDKSLSQFDLKASEIYPQSILNGDLKRYGKIIFGMSLFLSDLLTRKSEDAGKFMEILQDTEMVQQTDVLSTSNLDGNSRATFKSKITKIVKSFLEFEFI